MMRRLHIIADTRQKDRMHETKERWWADHGVSVMRSKVHVGDYVVAPAVSIDTKRNVGELAQDIDSEHERFRAECVTARECGTTLIILVENDEGVSDLASLSVWKNPRRFANAKNGLKPPIDGARLAKACSTMQDRYGVIFQFCKPADSARIIADILSGGDFDG